MNDKVRALIRTQDAFPGKSAVLNDAMNLLLIKSRFTMKVVIHLAHNIKE